MKPTISVGLHTTAGMPMSARESNGTAWIHLGGAPGDSHGISLFIDDVQVIQEIREVLGTLEGLLTRPPTAGTAPAETP